MNWATALAIAAGLPYAWLAFWFVGGFVSGHGVTIRTNAFFSLVIALGLAGYATLAVKYLDTL